MNVSDARRDSQSIRAEHRHNVQVLSTILYNRHSPGERFGQRRMDDDLRWGLTGAGERDNRGRSRAFLRGLSHGRESIEGGYCSDQANECMPALSAFALERRSTRTSRTASS